jgi:outer membrane immunogenic protein
MKKTFGAAAFLFLVLPAMAADVPRGPVRWSDTASGAPNLYDWSGGYLGVNLGYLWGTVTHLHAAPSGIAGGGQAGYNWQAGRLVFGGEADIQGSSAEDMFAPYKFSNPWFGTLRARAGYAFENVLLYATAGLAYGGGRLQIAGLSESESHLGWSGGAGVELGLTPHWSARAEYLFIGLSDKTYVLSGISSGIESHSVRLGVNYRF